MLVARRSKIQECLCKLFCSNALRVFGRVRPARRTGRFGHFGGVASEFGWVLRRKTSCFIYFNDCEACKLSRCRVKSSFGNDQETLSETFEMTEIDQQNLPAESGEASEVQAAAEAPLPPTQAQLYDDLRRIGQLEDQKLAIQQEIDERTERLTQALPNLDPNSLLYRMLSTSLVPPKKASARPATRSAKKKPARKASRKK